MKKSFARFSVLAALVVASVALFAASTATAQAQKTPKKVEQQGKTEEDKAASEKREAEEKLTLAALASCEKLVTRRLKAPATAKFPPFADPDVEVENLTDYFVVNGFVDSQNGFGALIRSTYICRVRLIEASGEWEQVSEVLFNVKK